MIFRILVFSFSLLGLFNDTMSYFKQVHFLSVGIDCMMILADISFVFLQILILISTFQFSEDIGF